MYDLLIKGGTVVDGTGRPRFRADVAVTDGKIVGLGDVDGLAHRVLDASDRIVAPGFIDIHTHYDVHAFWDPTLAPSSLHGVTTIFGGNCGFTVAPLSPDATPFLIGLLSEVEGMPLESLKAGAPWDWNTVPEYLDRLDGTLSLNAGFLVGHSPIRRAVMGEAASERTATPEEVAKMQDILREGIAAGGIGFSSSWGHSDLDDRGRPVPSRCADVDELIALASVCSEFEGTSLEFIPGPRPFSEASLDAMARMSAAARRALNWNVLFVKASTLDSALEVLGADDYARAAGGRVVALVGPSVPHPRFSFRSGYLLASFPGWAEAMALDYPEKLVLLSDPEQRRALADRAASPHHYRHLADWDDRVITETFSPALKHYEGRRVGDIAAEQGKSAFDALLDIACADELRTIFMPPDVPQTREDLEAMRTVWRDDRALIGASDAGAHLDFLDTFAFSTMFLEAVRTHGVADLEEAVQQLTSKPAALYGIQGRGTIAEGFAADLVIFDEHTIGAGPVHTRHDLPAGGGRLFADAIGIEQVIVNGEIIVNQGVATDARPGTLLRSGRDTTGTALPR